MRPVRSIMGESDALPCLDRGQLEHAHLVSPGRVRSSSPALPGCLPFARRSPSRHRRAIAPATRVSIIRRHRAEPESPRSGAAGGAVHWRSLCPPRARAQPDLGLAAADQPRELRPRLPRCVPHLPDRHDAEARPVRHALDRRARLLRLRRRAAGRLSALRDPRAHLPHRDVRPHDDRREPDPVDLDGGLPAARNAIREEHRQAGRALHRRLRPDGVRRGRGADAVHLGLATLDLSGQGHQGERGGRRDGRRLWRRSPTPGPAPVRAERRVCRGRRALHRHDPHAGAVADLRMDGRRLRRGHHRPSRQCAGSLYGGRRHRDQRGAHDGGDLARLGAARLVHAAHRRAAAAARAVTKPRTATAAGFVVVGALLALLPALSLPAFYETFLYLVFLGVALATSWNIVSGYAGYFSFGHAAFFGSGVYTTATLTSKYTVPFLATLPLAGLVAALLGAGIGLVAFRVRGVRGELFALLTLAITFVLATIVLNTPIDGGPGVFLAAVPVPPWLGSSNATLYLLSVVVALGSVAVAYGVQSSRWGAGLFAIRDDEDVGEVLGVPTYRYKVLAFVTSSFIAGVVGGIYAIFVTYVTVPDVFSIGLAVDAIMMAVLGGTRYWFGPACGAAIVSGLTRTLTGGPSAILNRALIGALLVAVIVFLPDGVAGGLARWRRRRRGEATGLHAVTAVVAAERQRPAIETTLLACSDVRKAFRGVQALSGATLEARTGEILG